MNRSAKIAIGVVTAAVSACSCAPALAAGTLLSGYGGPGQGSQAVLGSTLLHGSGKGSGGSSGGRSAGGTSQGSPRSSTPSATSQAQPTEAPASGSPAQQAGSSGRSSRPSGKRGAAHGSGPAAKHGHPSATGAPTRGAEGSAEAPFAGYTAAQSASAGSPLGISGGDLLLVILVLAALAFTGVLTVRLASGRPQAATKGSRGAA